MSKFKLTVEFNTKEELISYLTESNAAPVKIEVEAPPVKSVEVEAPKAEIKAAPKAKTASKAKATTPELPPLAQTLETVETEEAEEVEAIEVQEVDRDSLIAVVRTEYKNALQRGVPAATVDALVQTLLAKTGSPKVSDLSDDLLVKFINVYTDKVKALDVPKAESFI